MRGSGEFDGGLMVECVFHEIFMRYEKFKFALIKKKKRSEGRR